MTLIDDPVASPAARKLLRLHLADGVGPIRLARLLARFGTVDDVLSASRNALQRVEGVGPAVAQAVLDARTDERAERELEHAERLRIRILGLTDADYPARLAGIPDPPTCLYVRGRLDPQDTAALAIVGTRRCTHYGAEQARRFAALVAGAGFTVVSGLARGIDAQAHEGALQARGRTLAVLGNGLHEVYPPEHQSLADQIVESDAGAILSEVPFCAAPETGNFPRRNRIVIGLSVGVLVVEAPRRSGALITAAQAVDYNREVFALPGRVDTPQATGTNQLIRDGARLVTCLEDILEELTAVERRSLPPDARSQPADPPPAPALFDLPPDEQAVLDALAGEERDLDSLATACRLPVPRITSAVMHLQLKGAVRRLPGSRFARR